MHATFCDDLKFAVLKLLDNFIQTTKDGKISENHELEFNLSTASPV